MISIKQISLSLMFLLAGVALAAPIKPVADYLAALTKIVQTALANGHVPGKLVCSDPYVIGINGNADSLRSYAEDYFAKPERSWEVLSEGAVQNNYAYLVDDHKTQTSLVIAGIILQGTGGLFFVSSCDIKPDQGA